MPWKGEKDPYKIWLSEIILQQTRVEQGWEYYQRFTRKYPSVFDLAKADDTEVFRLWQGLGYYNRCKNMLDAARKIARENNGRFPAEYEQILALPGVGKYTAAAISSFAYGLPFAVVDGNVQRLLARFFGVKETLSSPSGKKIFTELAEEILYKKNPAKWNQSMMDFGATVCTPQKPKCKDCPFRSKCFAFQHNLTDQLPVKNPGKSPRKRYFTYIVWLWQNQILIHKRTGSDIWRNLHEFFLIEEKSFTDVKVLLKNNSVLQNHADDIKELSVSRTFRRQLTHQTIYARFLSIKIIKKPNIAGLKDFFAVNPHEMGQYAMPKIILDYLEEKKLKKSQTEFPDFRKKS